MTIRYCGSGGNDANSGLTWALRKLTLNGVEDSPVAAGDTVYVGPGTYRELLTCDISGSGGSPIAYIGDYLGTNTDGVGGVVRITGSDDDLTPTRNNCLTINGKNYRTFTGFLFDVCNAGQVLVTSGWNISNLALNKCVFGCGQVDGILMLGDNLSNANILIDACVFTNSGTGVDWIIYSGDAGSTVQNCIFLTGYRGIKSSGPRFTIKNNTFILCADAAIYTETISGGTLTANNNTFYAHGSGVRSAAAGQLTEDYNNFFACATDRQNVAAGANSVSYPTLFDTRWAFQLMLAGAGPYSPLQIASPFDLSSFSQLLNLAGTSPSATDLRGTAAQGAQREWGALEQDSTLKIYGGIKKGRVRTGY